MTFNFTIISEQYPKSFEKLNEWICIPSMDFNITEIWISNHAGSIFYRNGSTTEEFNPLELTAFFDGQGIIGDVYLRLFDIEDHYAFNIHYYSQGTFPSPQSEENKIEFPTRELALAECWNKCFEISEKQLSIK